MAWRWGVATAAALGLSLLLLSQVGDADRTPAGAQRGAGGSSLSEALHPTGTRPTAGAVSSSGATSSAPAPARPQPTPPPPSVDAPPSTTPNRVDWSGGLAVSVRFPDGTPAIGAEVVMTYGSAEVRGLTDAVGLASLRYEVGTDLYPAPPAKGRPPMQQPAEVTALVERDDRVGFAVRGVQLREGQEVAVELELSLGFALDLRLDRPLGYGHARVAGPHGTSTTLIWREGATRFFSEIPGRYRVSLEGASPDSEPLWAEGEVELGDAPRTTLLLRVRPLGRVAVRLLDVEGAPCSGWITAYRVGWSGEDGMRFLNAELTGAFHSGGPFDAAAPARPDAPVELSLPPGRWRVTGAAGSDTTPVARTLDVAGRHELSLRLEAAADTQVGFAPHALDEERGELEIFLWAPPGASLAWCEGGVRIGGLRRGAQARVAAVHLGEDDSETVGVVLVRGGERARLEFGGHGGLAGRVTGVEERQTHVQLQRAGDPAFTHRCTVNWSELREEAEYAAEDLEPGSEAAPYTVYVEALSPSWLDNAPLSLSTGAESFSLTAPVLGKDTFGFVDEGTPLGSFLFECLAPGRYRVLLRDTPTDAVLCEGPEVTIVAGETAPLEFAAPPD